MACISLHLTLSSAPLLGLCITLTHHWGFCDVSFSAENRGWALRDLSMTRGALYTYLALPKFLNQAICVLIMHFPLQHLSCFQCPCISFTYLRCMDMQGWRPELISFCFCFAAVTSFIFHFTSHPKLICCVCV